MPRPRAVVRQRPAVSEGEAADPAEKLKTALSAYHKLSSEILKVVEEYVDSTRALACRDPALYAELNELYRKGSWFADAAMTLWDAPPPALQQLRDLLGGIKARAQILAEAGPAAEAQLPQVRLELSDLWSQMAVVYEQAHGVIQSSLEELPLRTFGSGEQVDSHPRAWRPSRGRPLASSTGGRHDDR